MNHDALIYHPVTVADRNLLINRTIPLCGMNCDLNFMNISSWQFRYHTEVAQWRTHLVFRFLADGHVAYMSAFDKTDVQSLLSVLLEESERDGHPFLLMGVCESTLPLFEAAMPGFFVYEYDRDYCDYIYRRENLCNLSGKKLQPKRNFINRFRTRNPDYVYRPLEPADFEACLLLDKEWMNSGKEADEEEDTHAERRSIKYVFANWKELQGTGGVVYVNDKLVAYTYGAPISDTVFDVCVEKADTSVEGAYATINHEFVCHLPEQYEFINREEDLGIEGLRKSKLSYQPEIVLKKYAVMAKHHFVHGQIQ